MEEAIIHISFSEARILFHHLCCDTLKLWECPQYWEAGNPVETGKNRGGMRQKKPCAIASENVLRRCIENTSQVVIPTRNFISTRTLTGNNYYTYDIYYLLHISKSLSVTA